MPLGPVKQVICGRIEFFVFADPLGSVIGSTIVVSALLMFTDRLKMSCALSGLCQLKTSEGIHRDALPNRRRPYVNVEDRPSLIPHCSLARCNRVGLGLECW